MLSPEECDQIITEASPHLPVGRVNVRVQAWRPGPRSLTTQILDRHGLPSLDAQIVRYSVDGFYDWHVDGVDRVTAHVVQLSDPSSYDGGVLEVDDGTETWVGFSLRGSITSFPAHFRHRATAVTSGERWALVAWDRPQ